MPITQTEPVQYSHDSQSDSNQDFDVTTVNPNAESTRMDGTHSHPKDGHVLHHTKPKADSMDQHAHQGVPSDLQGLYIGHGRSPASLQSELDQA